MTSERPASSQQLRIGVAYRLTLLSLQRLDDSLTKKLHKELTLRADPAFKLLVHPKAATLGAI